MNEENLREPLDWYPVAESMNLNDYCRHFVKNVYESLAKGIGVIEGASPANAIGHACGVSEFCLINGIGPVLVVFNTTGDAFGVDEPPIELAQLRQALPELELCELAYYLDRKNESRTAEDDVFGDSCTSRPCGYAIVLKVVATFGHYGGDHLEKMAPIIANRFLWKPQ
jgi:hypothetical protein